MIKDHETICDICGKDMPSTISIESATRKYDFTITSSEKIWDICDACRRDFKKWIKTRKPERRADHEKIMKELEREVNSNGKKERSALAQI